MPFGFDSSSSFSERFGSSRSASFVDPRQQPFLDFTRNLAAGTLQNQLGAQQSLFGLSDQLLGQGSQLVGQLQNAGSQLEGFGSPSVVNAQIGQLGADLGAFFQNQINPAIRRDAVSTGGLGGGRQQVAQGVAAGELGRAFTGGVTDILQGAEDQRLRAASAQAGIQTQGALGALGQLSGLMGIAQTPFQQQLNPLLALSSIIGGPTVLQRSSSVDRQTSRSSGFGFDIGSIF